MRLQSFCFSLLALTFTATLHAQQSYKSPCSNPSTLTVKTFFLTNASADTTKSEILPTIRDMVDPCIKLSMMSSQNAIIVNAPPEQLALAEKIIQDLDRPQHTYRLHITFTESDGPNTVLVRRYQLDMTSGIHTGMNQIVRVPTVKVTYNLHDPKEQWDANYLDVGLTLSALLEPTTSGLRLTATVQQSTITSDKSAAVPQNPVLHQHAFDAITLLKPGTQALLGSLDSPDTGHHLEITVMAEATS